MTKEKKVMFGDEIIIKDGAFKKDDPHKDIGKQKFRVRRHYTAWVEYEVVAKSKEEAEDEDGDEGENKKDEGDQEKENQPKEGDQEKQQPAQPRQTELSPEQVKSLLEAMSNQEKKVQDKVNAEKVQGTPVRGQKDW